ncbi:MAG TPA: DNA alkylation repair protein [Paracoccaceae bacterium]|nr:DNA alkylation repair protein [Paracoccaceae bacterium]
MTPDAALAALEALADPGRAAEMAAYHKATRVYLGVPVPAVDALAKDWRAGVTLEARIALAQGLWETDVHEARVAAARLLTQARIRPDGAVWAPIAGWVPTFDAWALADHASAAGGRRLVADPARLDEVEGWVGSPRMWTRRAALVMTLPWTRANHPTAQDLAVRDRVLGWCAALASDRDWFIQKAVAWLLRDLSRHDAPRTRAWLSAHGEVLKPWAQREAARHLGAGQGHAAPGPRPSPRRMPGPG